MPPSRFLLRCAQLSGLTAVGYELLWTRRFSYFFGSTAQVFACILVAVLTGIAAGAATFGWLSRNRRLTMAHYGILELAVGGGALLSYFGSAWLFVALRPVAFAGTLALTTGTAALVGMSLPWIARYLREREPTLVDSAYSFYNLGGALGAILVGCFLCVFAGYAVTCGCLFAGNAALGLYFLRRGGGQALEPLEPRSAGRGARAAGGRRTWGVVLALGFVTMFVETLHGQLLDYLLGGTRIGIASTLAVYFLGVSFGARQPGGGSALGRLRATVAGQIGALALLAALCCVPAPGGVPSGKLVGAVVLALYFAFSFFGGRQFPALVAWVGGPQGFTAVFYLETLAAAAGALAFAFVAIPRIPLEATVVAAAAALLVVEGILLSRERASAPVAIRFAVLTLFVGSLGVSLPAPETRTLMLAAIASMGAGDTVVARSEDANGLLLVVRKGRGDDKLELRNAYYVAGSADPIRKNTQVVQGLLAASLLPERAKVLQIGFGNGQITKNLLLGRPAVIDVVELHPKMIALAQRYFPFPLSGAGSEVRPLTRDGVAYVQSTAERYDLVMSDGFVLSSELSTKLYTRDHFTNVRRILTPEGLLVTWLPTNVGAEASLSVLKSLVEVFPRTHLYYPSVGIGREIFAVSSIEPVDLLVRQRDRLVAMETATAAEPDLPMTADYLWSRWCLDAEGLARLLAAHPGVAAHTEDRPILEFYASVLGRSAPVGRGFADELVARRDPEALAAALSRQPSVRSEWRRVFDRHLELERLTHRYLDGDAASLARIDAEYPKTNVRVLLHELQRARELAGSQGANPSKTQ